MLVDLPAPFGPSSPNTSASATDSERSRNATVPDGYVLPSPWTSAATGVAVVSPVVMTRTLDRATSETPVVLSFAAVHTLGYAA